MTEHANLTEFVDFLLQASNENPIEEWCFFGGKLYPALDLDQMKKNNKNLTQDRSSVMKQVSESVKSNSDALLKATSSRSQQYSAFSKNDIESISGYFNYYTGWSSKTAFVLATDFQKKEVAGSTCCFVLDDCPIFSTLSRFVASNYAAHNEVRIYVKKKYLIPALAFAFFLYKAGMNPNDISVFPSTHGTFPVDNIFHEHVNGILPTESPLTVRTSFSENKTNNFYFRKHSLRPVLVLKSADIDSVIVCLTKSTRDLEALWLPNIIYVEEPVYKKFLDSLKFAVNLTNEGVLKSLDSSRQDRLDALVNKKNDEGYEVVILHHLYHSCLFVVNHEFTLVDPAETDGKNGHHFISILPVRHEAEGVSEMNKNKGLCASVWTNDAVQIISVPFNLKYGTVWLNCAGLYDPSVPLPMWNSHGTGSFSGKRMLFESITTPVMLERNEEDCLCINEADVILQKRTLSEILKQTPSVFEWWSKPRMEERLSILKSTVDMMERNQNSHTKISPNDSSTVPWNLCVDSVRFWSTFVTESAYEQNFFVRNCLVSCKSEPVGVIAILAGAISLEKLFFYVTAALVYGNVVIVGISSDQRSSFVAIEFEQLFKKGLVTMLMGTSSELWKQFTTASNIASVWFYVDRRVMQLLPPTRTFNHQIFYNLSNKFEPRTVAEFIETYATKAKCVWLPHLDGTIEGLRTSY